MVDRSLWIGYTQSNTPIDGCYRYKMTLLLNDFIFPQVIPATDYIDQVKQVATLDVDSRTKLSGRMITGTVYTNSSDIVAAIAVIDPNRNYRLVEVPRNLEPGSVYLPEVNYEFRVKVRKSSADQHAFANWAEKTGDVHLPASFRIGIRRAKILEGAYFYVSGSNNLLMVKMFLGDLIKKVEKIVN